MVRRILAKLPRRGPEFLAAGLAVVLILSVAIIGVWVFRPRKPDGEVGLSQLVLSDSATLGFVRAAVIALAVYVIASDAALLARGRWIRSFRSGGFEADDGPSIEGVAALEAGALRAKEIRDELRRLLEEYPHG